LLRCRQTEKGKVQEGERLLPLFLGGVQGKERPRRAKRIEG
jgi:hypothetical protein